MGILLKFLGGPLGMYALIAVGVLLTGSFAYGTYEHLQLKAADVTLASKDRDLQIVVRSNNSKDAVIAAQKDALDKWATYADVQSDNEKASIIKIEAAEAAQRITEVKLHELEKKDYELPDCAKYLAIDVAVVCPAHSSGVRSRIASSNN